MNLFDFTILVWQDGGVNPPRKQKATSENVVPLFVIQENIFAAKSGVISYEISPETVFLEISLRTGDSLVP
jgi:hypothetical protein